MQPLLLLHGAIGAASQLSLLADKLKDNYQVYTLSFAGHGGNALPDAPFSIPLFAAGVLRFLDENKLDQVSVFGYSMGGYVAMYLALHHPGRIKRIITLATKFHWDEATAAREIQMLNAGKIAQKVPAFAEALRGLHHPQDWAQVLLKTAEMMTAMGQENPLKVTDYPAIAHPSLLLLGDRDKMVGLDETLAVYRALPNAQMGMLPGTPHPIDQVDAELLSYYIRRFLL